MRRLITLLCLSAAAVVAIVLVSTSGAQPNDAMRSTPAEVSSAADRLHQVFPSATVDLVGDQARHGLALKVALPAAVIALPEETVPLTESNGQVDSLADADALAAGEIGWKLTMSAAVIATENPNVVSYAGQGGSGATLTPEAEDYLQGMLRSGADEPLATPARPDLGSITQDAALGQLRSNVHTLTRSLPTGQLVSNSERVVPVDPSRNSFGLEADIRVRDLSELQDLYGDFVSGLATGLNGGENANVDGLSVVVRDQHGQFMATWRTERVVGGSVLWSHGLHVPRAIRPMDSYPNLTGGPTTNSVGL